MPDPADLLEIKTAELQAAGEELNRCHAELAELQRKLDAEREKCAALLEALKRLCDKVDAYCKGHGLVGADLILTTEAALAAIQKAQP